MHLHSTKTPPHPHDTRTRGLLRVSSLLRMLVELAPREKPAELERLVTEGVRKRVLRIETPDELARVEAALERHAGYPGITKVRTALTAYRRVQDSKSNLERAFDELLRQHPEIPAPVHNIYIEQWEIDRYWPEHKLCIELDGRPYHVAVKDMERDRHKDAQLQKLGQIPIRVTDFRFEHDPEGVVTDLRHFLRIDREAAA